MKQYWHRELEVFDLEERNSLFKMHFIERIKTKVKLSENHLVDRYTVLAKSRQNLSDVIQQNFKL